MFFAVKSWSFVCLLFAGRCFKNCSIGFSFVALAVYAFRSVTVKSVLRLRFKVSFSVALRPQRLYGLLGTEIKSKVTDLWRFKVHSFEAMAG